MTDRKTVLAVVLLLGVFAIAGLLATAALIWADKPAASVAVVSGLTGTSIGALSGLLASTKSTAEPPPYPPNLLERR